MNAALSGELVKFFDPGGGMVQAVERAMFVPGTFKGDQVIEMAGHLDRLTATEAAPVVGDW